jgi:ketosteroid isomerase-like protein
MSSNTPAAPGTEAAQAWVLAFAEGWQAPASAEAFADHFQPWFDPQIRLIQPQLPTLVGHQAFRERFAGPLFALIPDLAGRVERFAIGAECAYVELTLRGTLGGRPISWRVCDRATLREGLVVERESYFDAMPLLRAILTRPRAWPALSHAWQRSRRHRTPTMDRRDATTARPPIRPPTTNPRKDDHKSTTTTGASSVATSCSNQRS